MFLQYTGGRPGPHPCSSFDVCKICMICNICKIFTTCIICQNNLILYIKSFTWMCVVTVFFRQVDEVQLRPHRPPCRPEPSLPPASPASASPQGQAPYRRPLVTSGSGVGRFCGCQYRAINLEGPGRRCIIMRETPFAVATSHVFQFEREQCPQIFCAVGCFDRVSWIIPFV